MSELLNEFLLEFSRTIRIDNLITKFLPIDSMWLIILGLLMCVLGFKIYRLFFTILTFFGIAETLTFFMREAPWRETAVFIAVLGTILGFMAFKWHRLGGFVICALFGATICLSLYPSIAAALVCAVIAGVAELYFPVITICIMTSIWGAWIFSDIVWEGHAYIGLFLFATSVISIAWQLFINRKQTTFTKPYPDKVKYWLEKRRCT